MISSNFFQGCSLNPKVEGKDVSVTVPTFRRDIAEEVDLIEEVARLYGYENIGREEEQAQLPLLRGVGAPI